MSVCTQKAKLSEVFTLEPLGAMKEANGIITGLQRFAVQLDWTFFMVLVSASIMGNMEKRKMIMMD